MLAYLFSIRIRFNKFIDRVCRLFIPIAHLEPSRGKNAATGTRAVKLRGIAIYFYIIPCVYLLRLPAALLGPSQGSLHGKFTVVKYVSPVSLRKWICCVYVGFAVCIKYIISRVPSCLGSHVKQMVPVLVVFPNNLSR